MDSIIQKLIRQRNFLLTLLKYPDREFTIRELSLEAKIPYVTTWRLVETSEKAGLLLVKRIGNYVVCSLNKKSPYLKEAKKAILFVSPQRKAAMEFVKRIKKLKEIKRIILFGTVAKGEEKPESDVDIAIIVSGKKEIEEKINKSASLLLKEARIRVIPLVLTEKEVNENKIFRREIENGEVLYRF